MLSLHHKTNFYISSNIPPKFTFYINGDSQALLVHKANRTVVIRKNMPPKKSDKKDDEEYRSKRELNNEVCVILFVFFPRCIDLNHFSSIFIGFRVDSLSYCIQLNITCCSRIRHYSNKINFLTL